MLDEQAGDNMASRRTYHAARPNLEVCPSSVVSQLKRPTKMKVRVSLHASALATRPKTLMFRPRILRSDSWGLLLISKRKQFVADQLASAPSVEPIDLILRSHLEMSPWAESSKSSGGAREIMARHSIRARTTLQYHSRRPQQKSPPSLLAQCHTQSRGNYLMYMRIRLQCGTQWGYGGPRAPHAVRTGPNLDRYNQSLLLQVSPHPTQRNQPH
ncbi:hypothetical protein BO99DRAFT_26497 [Aspergillus violaceofuscus CBS 115571]|uniref:Uncharacterized protein n=1 Tax=Aspergillus violaceofuscus (strain CBS 115571) TaxID=1450538 RepID=A0A2V5GT59_ASPV1|nr:hypothetical protein BO99DRAFT_26497 [Aspergillus violaceofuscus CBS 115571]